MDLEQEHSPHTAPRLRVSHGAVTSTGRVREHNEDAFTAAPPVFLVADGMGGHHYGALAARTALAAFDQLIGRPFVPAEKLDQCLSQAARQVAGLGDDQVAPGSTLTGLVLSLQGERPCLRVVNIGDSRTYHLSQDTFCQVTKDHSHVQELVDAGFISPQQARTRADRSVITRALGAGTGPVVQVDQALLPAVQGDRLLLCSDGLSGLVPDTQIEEVLRQGQDPQQAASQLVGLALAAGGNDNITVVVLDVEEVEPSWEATGFDGSTQPQAGRADDTIPRLPLLADELQERP